MVKSQHEVTEVLQEATRTIAAQQTETARLTTDAARQICEVRTTGNTILFSSFLLDLSTLVITSHGFPTAS